MRPSSARKRKRRNLPFLPILVVAVIVFIFSSVVSAPETKKTDLSPPSAIFNKAQHSINDPNSIWVVVNKGRVLPKDYEPADLVTPNVALRLSRNSPDMMMRREAAMALELMFAQAQKDGVKLMIASAYRSYDSQASLYNGYVRKDGQAAADLYSARPGHSEHQTGLAVDVEPTSRKCEVEQCFADTPEGKWVDANAHLYGFMITYQKGKHELTGYQYEPWHIRYVGKELAMELKKINLTVEQFFRLPTFKVYPADIFSLRNGT